MTLLKKWKEKTSHFQLINKFCDIMECPRCLDGGSDSNTWDYSTPSRDPSGVLSTNGPLDDLSVNGPLIELHLCVDSELAEESGGW